MFNVLTHFFLRNIYELIDIVWLENSQNHFLIFFLAFLNSDFLITLTEDDLRRILFVE